MRVRKLSRVLLVAGMVATLATGVLPHPGAGAVSRNAPQPCLAGSTGSTGAPAARHWVAGWTAAPTDGLANLPPLHQTYRIRVVPQSDGDRVRLRLSNRFGLGPVTFGAVSLGRQAEGPALVAATLREARFAGSRSVVVPRGQDVLSDPVQLRVRAGENLLASIFVIGVPGPATQHVLAGQTTWQSPPFSGDATGDTRGAPFFGLPLAGVVPALPQAIPYLTALEVHSRAEVGAVVTFGDSLTDGFQGAVAPVLPVATNIDLDARYPDHLARRVHAARLPYSVVNAGISGNQLLRDGTVPIFGPSGLSRLARDALDQPGTRTVILWEGINDIGQSSASAGSLIAGYAAAVRQAHARGIRILLGTLTPGEGTLQPGYGLMAEQTRSAVNRWIRTQRISDGFVDFDAAVRDPARPTRILPVFDGGDHLHFSPAGYAAIAEAVPLDLLGPPTCSRPERT